MNETKLDGARQPSTAAIVKGPIWPLLLPLALGVLLRLWTLPASVSPRFFPHAESVAAPDGTRLLSAILFGLVVLAVAVLSRELGGTLAGLGAGIVLALCWPALVLSAMQWGNVALTLVLLIGLGFVAFGRRLSSVGWGLWALLALLLALPVLRNTGLGTSILLPLRPTDAILLFWRQEIPRLSTPIFLGSVPLFALGLSSLLVSRTRPGARAVALLLFVLVLVDWFWPLGSSFDLGVLALFAVLGGVWFSALRVSWNTSQRKALGALMVSLLVLLAVGSYFTRVSGEDATHAEVSLRLERAKEENQQGETQAALKDLAWILKQEPKHEGARFLQAWVLLRERQFKQAAMEFKELLRDTPESAQVQTGIGWSNYYLGNFVTSKMAFTRALSLEPNNASCMVGMGLSKFAADNDLDGGEELIRKGLKRDPDIAEGYAGLAMILLKRGNETPETIKQLREYVEKTIELDPKNDIVRRFARRRGWYDLLPESERPPNWKELMKQRQSQQ